LLSWRVAILPFLEQEALYNLFHLDEPWDSPHNKALISLMPPTYACPSARRTEPGLTSYRGVLGKGAPFEVTEGRRLPDFTDGTAFTIMVAEAKEAVPWTKPDELPLDDDPMTLLGRFGSPHPGGFNATFADGSVKFIKNTIAPKIFR